MGYVTVKGGAEAILEAEKLASMGSAASAYPEIDIGQVREHMKCAVDQVMGEGGLYAPELAALAIKQAEGDMFEAAFLLRAYRSTLPRLGYSVAADTHEARVIRRISSTFKDIPGGQVLGATRDYTERLLNFGLLHEKADAFANTEERTNSGERVPIFAKVIDMLRQERLVGRQMQQMEAEPFDITRESIRFPAPRSARLQALCRGETGAMLCLAYSSMRGFGGVHPTLAELRVAYLPLKIKHPYTGRVVKVGEVLVTECESVCKVVEKAEENSAPQFSLGYGLVFGQNERKVISMSILDRAMASKGNLAPAEDQEFVLYHIDGVDSMGFVEHLKLPHYVTFQSALDRMRKIQQDWLREPQRKGEANVG